MNTSLTWTIKNFGCRLLQGNISVDAEIPIVSTLTTSPKEMHSNKHNDKYFEDYIANLKDQTGSTKKWNYVFETRADREKQSDKLFPSQKSCTSILYLP